jgi:hypothetical protein
MAADDPRVAAFRRLAVKEQLSLGGLHGARYGDFVVLTAAAALAFAPGRLYREPEVNATLKAWLAAAGAMLATDHVELRRWLVDCGLLARDGYGRAYERAVAPEAWTDALASLAGHDLAAMTAEVRREAGVARAARRAAWEARPATTGTTEPAP